MKYYKFNYFSTTNWNDINQIDYILESNWKKLPSKSAKINDDFAIKSFANQGEIYSGVADVENESSFFTVTLKNNNLINTISYDIIADYAEDAADLAMHINSHNKYYTAKEIKGYKVYSVEYIGTINNFKK